MSVVLLSIKRPFVQKIMSGIKYFEYRKILPQEKPSHVVIYESAGRGRIVGSAAVDGCLSGSVQDIWKITGSFSGVEADFYRRYFDNRLWANAFCLGDITEYERPVKLSDVGIASPPQSFMYLAETVFDEIRWQGCGELTVKKSDRRILVLGYRPVEDMAFAKSVANAMRLGCFLLDNNIASFGCEAGANSTLLIQGTMYDNSRNLAGLVSGGVLYFRFFLNDGVVSDQTLEELASMLEELKPTQIIMLSPDVSGSKTRPSLKSEEVFVSGRMYEKLASKYREIESIAGRMRIRFTHVRI